jgi:hypothetical protein
MADPIWTWDGERYHDPANGHWVGRGDFPRLRDQYIDSQQYGVSNYSEIYASGDMTREQFIETMRETIRSTYVDEYSLGRGGKYMVTKEEWLEVARDVKGQYRYLNNFANEVEAARAAGHPFSPEYIANRAKMYVDSGTKAFEKASARAMGIPLKDANGNPSLPAYPGDGQTPCRVNCRCRWDIVETETGWDCTWVLGDAQHCKGCEDNSKDWAPLHIERAG